MLRSVLQRTFWAYFKYDKVFPKSLNNELLKICAANIPVWDNLSYGIMSKRKMIIWQNRRRRKTSTCQKSDANSRNRSTHICLIVAFISDIKNRLNFYLRVVPPQLMQNSIRERLLLEKEHADALQSLRQKQDEIKRLQEVRVFICFIPLDRVIRSTPFLSREKLKTVGQILS